MPTSTFGGTDLAISQPSIVLLLILQNTLLIFTGLSYYLTLIYFPYMVVSIYAYTLFPGGPQAPPTIDTRVSIHPFCMPFHVIEVLDIK